MAALREETLQIRHQMVRMTNSDKLTRGETHFLLFINARHVKIHYCKQFCNNKNPCKMKAPNWKKFCTSMGSLLVNLPNEWRSLKPPIASTSMLSGRKMEFYSIHRCCRKKSYLISFLWWGLFRSTDFKVIGNLTYNGYRGTVSETVFQPSTGVFKASQAGLYLFLFHANTVFNIE